MKNKKIISVFLSCALIASLSGCAGGVDQAEYDELKAKYDELAEEYSAYKEQMKIYEPNELESSDQQSEEVGNELKATYEVTETSDILVRTENTSGKMLGSVTIQASYFKEDNMIGAEEETYYQIPNGRKLAYKIPKPVDEDYNLVDFDEVKLNITTTEDEGFFVDVSDALKIEHNKGASEIMINCMNVSSDTDINYLKFQVIYYQGDEAISSEIAVDSETIAPGQSRVLKADFPFDSNYDPMSFDRYEVLLSECHE